MTQILKNKSDDLPLNDLIVQTILSNIPALARGKDYLAKDLMGSDVWATLSIRDAYRYRWCDLSIG